MKKHRRDEVRSRREALRKWRKFWRVAKYFVAIALLAGFGVLAAMFIKAEVSEISEVAREIVFEKNYFEDSKHEGVSSHIIERKSAGEDVFLEFPKVGVKKIDFVIEEWVAGTDNAFKLADTGVGDDFQNEIKTHKMSYQVFFSDDEWLSLAIFSHRETHGAHHESSVAAWTFDKKSGDIVPFSKLIKTGGEADFLATAKGKILASFKNKEVEISGEDLVDLSFRDFDNFILLSKDRMKFDFSPAEILPHSFGEVSFEVGVDEIANVLNDGLATRVFDFEKPKNEEIETTTPEPEVLSAPTTPSSAGSCENCVALTFDDGPRVGMTDRLLDILKAKNAKVTFFVLGENVAKNPAIIARMAKDGHEIGNHTWNHPQLTKLNAVEIEAEISKTNDAIFAASGSRPKFIRQPYGATNATVEGVLKKLDMSGVLWSVDTRDWADKNASVICNRAVTSARAGGIILLHDIHPTSVDAVGCIIDGLAKKGLTTATVGNILGDTVAGKNYYSAN